MPTTREFVLGPWRAVLVLGVTQIIAWGAIFYPPVLTVPLIAAERGWSTTFAMGGFSLGATGGGNCLAAGRASDRPSWRPPGDAGGLAAGGAGLVGLVYAEHPVSYLAVWVLLGVAIGGVAL